jgi:hypothetical protein
MLLKFDSESIHLLKFEAEGANLTGERFVIDYTGFGGYLDL